MQIKSSKVLPKPEKRAKGPKFTVDSDVAKLANRNLEEYAFTGKEYVKEATELENEAGAAEFVKHLKVHAQRSGFSVRATVEGAMVTWYAKDREPRRGGKPAMPQGADAAPASKSPKARKNASASA